MNHKIKLDGLNLSLIFCFFMFATSCSLTKPVKTGEMAYSVKQYAVAIELLEEEYKHVDDKLSKNRKAILLAKCYDILQNFDKALEWFDVSDQLESNEQSTMALAYALKKSERYKDASILFGELHKKTNNSKYFQESRLCENTLLQIENQGNYVIESFSINTEYSEYSPVFFKNDFIVFSSDRKGSTGNSTYNTTGNNFSDLYVMTKRGRQVSNFDAIINTSANEGTVCFNKAFDEIFFTRCVSSGRDGQFCKIFYSKQYNDYWIDPVPIMFFDDNTNFFHPALIENDSVLIFSAAANGSTTFDLYYSERVDDGWTEAILMPTVINTTGNEKFPTVYNDTLFFSSDGHIGLGGLDVFKTYLRNDGSWSNPVNMGLPINSGADDFGLVISNKFVSNEDIQMEGFLSSSRNYGNSDDIFFFTVYQEEKKQAKTDDTNLSTISPEYRIYLAGRVVEVLRENNDPNKAIIGKRVIPESDIYVTSADTSMHLESDDKGRFLLEMNSQNIHKVFAKRRDYLNNQIEVMIPSNLSINRDTTINVELLLERIVYDSEIVIPNIYYDFEKWDIRKDAEPSLDSLSKMLLFNPEIRIELASHTDCRGERDFNQELSKKRAQSVVAYLVTKGIDDMRIRPKGYGESNPNVNCRCDDCSEEEHQINRRTTFRILRADQ